MLLCSFVILLKKDIKTFVAYRRVIHMGLIVLGVLRGTPYGFAAAVLIMLAHGLSSSGLFCLAAILASKTGGRGITLIKGQLVGYPKLALFVFLVVCLNMAAPPSLNLLGELMSVVPFLIHIPILYPLLAVIIFLSVAINMYLYCRVSHGKRTYAKFQRDLRGSQLLCIFAHLFPYLLLLKLEILL